MKKVIATAAAPQAVGPYSQAVEADGTVYVSGQLPIDPISGVLGPQVGHVARFPEMNLDRGETVLEIDAGDARPANQSLHFVQQIAGRRGAEVCEKYLRRSHVLNKLG